jgi:hypothetical protein
MVFDGALQCRAACLILVTAVWAIAQITSAVLSGVVVDPSGKVVPRAAVRVIRIETGAQRLLATDDEGRYVVSNLEPGMYEVEVGAPAFRTQVRRGIELTVGREANVEVQLEIGSVQEKVVVTGDAPLIETDRSSMGAVVQRRTIGDLPLNGRDFTQLTLLAPGVVNVTTAASNTFLGLTRRIAVAGARPSSGGVYLLDGANLMGFFNDTVGNPALGTALGVDAIQEFKIETNNFSPAYGRAGAAVINAISRSGSNNWHGSAFEYVRNSALDARNFFDPEEVPAFRRNQFGASLGGPVTRDRTFFFANYEGLIERLSNTTVGATPTAQARSGALPDGQVLVNPAIVPLLDLFPLPNGPQLGGGVGVYSTAASKRTNESYVLGRLDHKLSERNTLFARLVVDNGKLEDPYPIPGLFLPFYLDSVGRNRYATLQVNSIISPRVVNSLRVSFGRTASWGDSTTRPPALELLPGVEGRRSGGVSIGGVGFAGPNSIVPYHLIVNNWTIAEDLSIVRNGHFLEMGFEWQKIQNPYRADIYSGGLLTFNNLRDFLTGNPFLIVAPVPDRLATERTWNQNIAGAYFTDSWRIHKRLTLNLGLRYEIITNPSESHGRISTLVNLSDPAVTRVPNVFAQNPSLRNFAPRFGFAYDPFGDGKTALRGGFGIFYQQYAPRNYGQYGFNPPETLIGVAIFPQFPIQPSTLFALPPSISLVTGYDIKSTPYMLQYNLNLQRELTPGFMVEVGGIFSAGRKLLGAYDYNTPLPNATLPDGTPIRTATSQRPNPRFSNLQFTFPMHSSSYAALTVRAEKRLGGSSRLHGSYTWGHSLDTQSNEFNGDGWNDSGNTMDITNLDRDHASSTFDVRHNLTVYYIYDVPGNRSWQGWTGWLTRNWQWTGIATFHSGLPFSAVNGFDRARTLQSTVPPNAADRPDVNPAFRGPVVIGSPDRWFDPAAFQLQPDGAYGNLGRNTLRGPGMASIDMGLTRQFPVGETLRLQFRTEMFNVLNRANFAVPDFPARQVFLDASGTVNPRAGVITRTVTTSRQLQFALRLQF